RIGVLSGPNFAKEIVQQQQTGTVIASEDESVITCVQGVLRSETFRVYANHDRYGVELGGALKNIYAIICGMAAALGAGHNTQAMLLTRSLAEMGRFAQTMGANPMTFLGLAGVGGLILTCTSDRKFRVYANHDRYGVELGGALKNIYAIICGMAAALGAGHNTQAMLLTRSLAEMGRFAQTMGANPMTFLGLAGVGDLILTCT